VAGGPGDGVVSDEQREVFRRAVGRARRQRGLTQGDVAAALGVSTNAVSLWELGETVPRAQLVSRLEAILGFEGGVLARMLGYVPLPPRSADEAGVLEAVEADPQLTEEQRDLLTGLYRQFVKDCDEGERENPPT
jgi:transcriptional regulator with XRE-family HTH domain